MISEDFLYPEGLQKILAAYHIPADIEQCKRLITFAKTLHHWNMTHNLTGAKDINAIFTDHIIDCAAAAQHIPKTKDMTLLDIGSGAGLPGLVIAILRPDLQVTLLEPRQKRVAFCRQCTALLQLVVVVHPLRAAQYTKKHACIISRAVSDVDGMIAMTQHLAQDDTLLLCMRTKPLHASYKAHNIAYAIPNATHFVSIVRLS